jgi:hypothetical protein
MRSMREQVILKIAITENKKISFLADDDTRKGHDTFIGMTREDRAQNNWRKQLVREQTGRRT